MKESLRVIPDKEVIEWYLSGSFGGRDGCGVAVRFNRETGILETDRNFANRVVQWRAQYPKGIDQFTLVETPDLRLLDDYIANSGVVFNPEKRRLERTVPQDKLLT